jgi:hypothetical protein
VDWAGRSSRRLRSSSFHRRLRARRGRVATLLVCVIATFGAILTGPGMVTAGAVSAGQRVDLRVLVMSDGSPTVEAIAAELASEGVPFTKVSLADSSRPTIDASFLSDTVATGPRAKFESVVLPNDNPTGLSAAEMTALSQFETTFGVRQVDSFTWPSANVGLTTVTTNGFAGTLDGMTARVTTAGKKSPFSYLAGPVPIDNNDPNVSESYGYIAVPATLPAGQSFTTMIDAPIPNTTSRGSLVGVYNNGAREQMVITLATNQFQTQFKLMAHGIITWMTRGVHLGYDRNYFTVHVDDVLNSDSRWSITNHCTPGEDCPAGVTTPDIRMSPSDVSTLGNWESQNGLTLSMVFNGGPSDDIVAASGSDPLKTAFIANANKQRWINHTYQHEFLGCIQDFTVIPWRCVTDANGNIVWDSQASIQSQISQNIQFATTNGIPINPHEVVTGEHSGLFVLPQQPVDNPNFGPALTALGMTTIAADNSRDPIPRQVGSARTVPRYPMSIFYNSATRTEEVSEYNWIYTSAADGGSGICSQNPATMTCIKPLDPTTGYTSYIVPLEATIDMFHVLNNDPRPHYVHQSNLTGDRILYPALNEILKRYRADYAASAPLVQPTFTQDSQILSRQVAWKNLADGTVTAYVLNGTVTIQSSSGNTDVPVTVPTGTRVGTSTGPTFGESYAGEQSTWTTVGAGPLVLSLPPGN